MTPSIPMIGAPVERLEGRAKVTGEARYATEHKLANAAWASLVSSTIPSGTIRKLTRPRR
ncbi:MAG: hypothetical protein JWO97_360 [Acidobacteria bacterium]|nr:hypothetical protein [Acidobacteriota bacterium]